MSLSGAYFPTRNPPRHPDRSGGTYLKIVIPTKPLALSAVEGAAEESIKTKPASAGLKWLYTID